MKNGDSEGRRAYEAPELVVLGTVADLTQAKEVGAADGTTFLGVDQGDVGSV